MVCSGPRPGAVFVLFLFKVLGRLNVDEPLGGAGSALGLPFRGRWALVVCRGRSSGRQQPRATSWGGRSLSHSPACKQCPHFYSLVELNPLLALSF